MNTIPPLPGTEINGRYRLDSELGRGGMGVVYRAQDPLLQRDVAIKMLSTTNLDTTGRGHLLHEARAAAGLNHPHIVAIYDAGEAQIDGQPLPYIVMELLAGPTLHEQPPKNLEETITITQQLCAALEHAHQKGMIHRDLKPENIMFAADGQVKLMDFGLARSVTTRLTAEGTIAGTLFYLAPETVLGGELDSRTDLYALGVMLYEMAAGRLPFSSTDPVAVISQHLHAPLVPPSAHAPEIPAQLDQLIVQLMAKDPRKRPSSAAEVTSVLDQINQSQALVAEPLLLSQLDRVVRGRLVGRSAEWSTVRVLWKQAASGQGQVLLISGEAGIGKTRLVHELIALARAGGGNALSGASYAAGGAPYGPFRTILRELLSSQTGHLPPAIITDILKLLPDLRVYYPDVMPPSAAGQIPEQLHLMESAAAVLRAASDQRPLLLVIEDLHWADGSTIALLLHLARTCRDQAIMIAVTFRDVEVGRARALHAALLDMQRERLSQRLNLNRLDHEGTGQLLATLLDEEATPDFVDEIYQQTEGNPFFIEEVCKALIDSGRLFFANGRWHHPPLSQLDVPSSIQAAIQSRMQTLSAGAQSILELAAIMGRSFEYGMLVRAGHDSENAVIDAIDEALGAQILEEVVDENGEVYSFVHALIPAAIVSDMRTLRRRRLHHQTAVVFEKDYPDDYERLAYHFVAAGHSAKSIEYLLKAGDSARSLYAHPEAITAYQQALALAESQQDTATMARILLKLGQTYHNALDFERSRDAYDRAFALRQHDQEPVAAERHAAPHSLRDLDLEPWNLDPSFGLFGKIKRLYSGLVRLNSELDILPDVAQGWEVGDGARKYLFHLRDDVYWSDGHLLTAGDFALTFRRALEPNGKSWLPGVLRDIRNAARYNEGQLANWDEVGVRVLDDFTLEIELDQPAGYFLHILTTIYPVPQHAVSRFGESWTDPDKIVTNGPFQLEQLKRGAQSPGMRLAANLAYHGRFTGNISQVDVHFYGEYNDPSAAEARKKRLQDFEHGILDILSLQGLDPAELRRARLMHQSDPISLPLLSVGVLYFDTGRPPFNDGRVRRAFALATDRAALANKVLDGMHYPASGGFIPPGMPGHFPGIALPYDPAQARRLLAEAGYVDGQALPRLSFVAPYWSEWGERQEAMLSREWRAILNAEVTFEWLTYPETKARLENNIVHMHIAGWTADYPDPDNFLNTAIPRKEHGWHNDRYEQIIEEARGQSNQEERLRLYREAEVILVDEAPILPLYYRRELVLVQPWVKNSPWDLLNGQFIWEDVIIEPH